MTVQILYENNLHNAQCSNYRDTLIVTIGNCLTSFFAGFAIFSVLGYLAAILKKDVGDVAQSGKLYFYRNSHFKNMSFL